jgi:hypothetical protein
MSADDVLAGLDFRQGPMTCEFRRPTQTPCTDVVVAVVVHDCCEDYSYTVCQKHLTQTQYGVAMIARNGGAGCSRCRQPVKLRFMVSDLAE